MSIILNNLVTYSAKKTKCWHCSQPVVKNDLCLYLRYPIQSKSGATICSSCLSKLNENSRYLQTHSPSTTVDIRPFILAKSNRRSCSCCDTPVLKGEAFLHYESGISGFYMNICLSCIQKVYQIAAPLPKQIIPEDKRITKMINDINKLKKTGDIHKIKKLLEKLH
jgi:hypothetical protein